MDSASASASRDAATSYLAGSLGGLAGVGYAKVKVGWIRLIDCNATKTRRSSPIMSGWLPDGTRDFFNTSESPSQISANITREWWEDQQRRYFPLEERLNEQLLDPEKRAALRQEGLNATTKAVEGSFDRAANRLETLRSRSNQSRDARSQMISKRTNANAKAAAGITARNSARVFMDETENQILGGS